MIAVLNISSDDVKLLISFFLLSSKFLFNDLDSNEDSEYFNELKTSDGVPMILNIESEINRFSTIISLLDFLCLSNSSKYSIFLVD